MAWDVVSRLWPTGGCYEAAVVETPDRSGSTAGSEIQLVAWARPFRVAISMRRRLTRPPRLPSQHIEKPACFLISEKKQKMIFDVCVFCRCQKVTQKSFLSVPT